MRILLVQPDSASQVNKEYMSLQYPINLGYIAAVLIRAGHEVKMIDFNVIERHELKNSIHNFNPSLVGVTSMTSSIYNAKDIINEVKAIDKKIYTVLGGVHASALPLETIREIRGLDFLVFGEGENTALELVKELEGKNNFKNVKGLVFKNKGKIIKNRPRELIKDLSSIPLPARGLLPIGLYNKQHVSRGFSRREIKIVEIMTSRGCPNNCIFCAGHLNYGFRLRFRTYEDIVSEIQECIDKYGVTHVSIEDDTFTLNRELVKRLCAFFKDKNFSWNCNARVNTVNYEMLKMMSDSGCKKISFGIESGNVEMLKKMKKGISISQAINTIRAAKKAGIRYVECTFMIGAHIDETLDSVRDTEKLIYQLKPDFLALSVMCPFPGTEIYWMMKEKGYLQKNPDWSQYTLFGDVKRYEKLRYLTSDQMIFLQKKIMKEYYSSPRYVISQLKQLRTLNEMKYFTKLGLLYIREFLLKKVQ